ncbi:alpha-1,2-mannosidase, putative [Novosphingobium sp. CF614]|uniref:GH92 family glycosyl hydrolase n=1 Tax=Novosphingobium sp. CF614 TaxID=1884364 RepID=UPI0008DFBD28|nr:GH92 family glycosyl hydrolase [Novosphingobium sp. CF614]SFG08129.1 alpha-1,2-mannosidase, putative [Novosphingobium sp. CF614]
MRRSSISAALLLSAAVLVSGTARADAGRALSSYVDPSVGTGNDNQGDTIIGPSLPAGSIHPSPETLSLVPVGPDQIASQTSNAGYNAGQPITGFAQLHSQGSGGVTTYGTFLVSPQTGPVTFDELAHASPKRDEHAAADSYAVTLQRYGTRVEIAPAHDAAIYRFSFPAGEPASLVFDVTRKVGGTVASDMADVRLDPATGTVTGRVRAKGYWSPALVDIWFAARVDRKPLRWGTAIDGVVNPGTTMAASQADHRLGAWLEFGDTGGQPVQMKIAVSFTSGQKALDHLETEIPGWDYEAVKQAAGEAWNRELGRVTIDGVGEADKRRFYTALYHGMILPRNRTTDRPDEDRGTPFWDDDYTLWDTYRTVFPLMSLVRPSDYAGNIRSFVRTFERFGAVDTAFIAGRNYHVGQGGDEVDNVLGEALLRGVAGVDWTKAAQVALFNATQQRSPRYLIEGYFAAGDQSPEPDNQRAKSGSSTLAYALNDFYAAQLARKIGNQPLATTLMKRSANWQKVWNPDVGSDGFTGFIIPRGPDGAFQAIDPKLGWDGKIYNNVGFYEGTAWIYSFGALHDVAGMVRVMGGRERFIERLQHALKSGLIDITNEPSFATPWLFIEVGRPDLASYWANQVFTRFRPDAYPGDEDSGAMGSHYVFNRIGLFPKLASDLFYLHAPHQPRATIMMEDGRRFTIVAANVAPDAVYICKARLNGKPLDHAWLSQGEIMAGGELHLSLSRKPCAWGRQEALVDHAVGSGIGEK